MWLGVDYYPEQWDISMIDEDMDNIVELGCNVIRIAEFAWHIMEKREGEYDFSYFDYVINKAKTKGLKVILGTPTATIPAWLAAKEPSILSEWENGQKRVFGGRHVYCFNSPVMYEYSEKIIRKMVEHYKGEGAVVAWQIDNELGHEFSDICYCEKCHRAFQRFLNDKFDGDIEKLNETYGTTFWSQEYNDFSEIPIPKATITTHNPALRLDWERFRSKSVVDFAEFQVNLIKEIDKDAVVIHDLPGGAFSKHLDYSKLAEHLDIVAYNNYPVWGGQKEPLKPHEIGFSLDYIRGLKKQNFWITEAIMGAQGHDVTGYTPRPNQAKMWSYQSFAHGCESMMYFRYRGATKGAEQFCYGILDADNVKRRKYYEVQSAFKDIANYEKELCQPIQSQVAIMYDYDSLAAFRIQRQSILLDNQKEMEKFYKTFYDVNVPVDIIPETSDLSGYKILILPQMIVEKPEITEKIKSFVRAGGTAILTYRTAVKDVNNNLTFGQVIPVNYSDFAGLCVVETESLQDGQEFPVVGKGEYTNVTGEGSVFRDMVEPTDAEVLFSYGDTFYDTFAAVTRKKQGEGTVYYLACSLDEATLKLIMNKVMKDNDIKGEETEDGIEVCYRGSESSGIRIIMNHTGETKMYKQEAIMPYESRIDRV